MKSWHTSTKRTLLTVAGALTVPAVWVFIKHVFGVPNRFLPLPMEVLGAVHDIEPSVSIHLAFTSLRLAVGFTLGVIGGIALALLMFRHTGLRFFFMPIVQSLRPIPAAAVIPFFLLWFGFSEWGRYLLVLTAVAFNIAIAAWQVAQQMPENHLAFFQSFAIRPGKLLWRYILPRILEGILPTLRFSMALAIGAVTVSELLGSQIGLGYLIQTSRATFSLHVLFLTAILLGILSALADGFLLIAWRRLVYWKHSL